MSIIALAIFLISFSVLSFEVILMKFFSFKMLSSWAFLIFSMAFLGIGAAGTFLYLYMKDKENKIHYKFLFISCLLFTVFAPASILFFAWIPYSPPKYLFNVNLIFNLIYFILFAIPFFLSSLCIGHIVSSKEIQTGKTLFYDLIGAGLGSIFSAIFIRPLGAYGILMVSTVCALIATVIFYFRISNKNKLKYIPLFIIPVIVLVFIPFFPKLMVEKYGFDINSTNREEMHFNLFNSIP